MPKKAMANENEKSGEKDMTADHNPTVAPSGATVTAPDGVDTTSGDSNPTVAGPVQSTAPAPEFDLDNPKENDYGDLKDLYAAYDQVYRLAGDLSERMEKSKASNALQATIDAVRRDTAIMLVRESVKGGLALEQFSVGFLLFHKLHVDRSE
jgi:hypothetical protein